MKTIKIKLLGVLTTLLLGATASFGQAIYYDADEGGVVIDCTMMPAGTILTKSMAGDDNQLPSHIETDEANTVYPKLVVAVEDLNSGYAMSWDNAVSAAQEYEDDLSGHTDWRLPNQRELILIWVLKTKLEAAGVSPFLDYYWSSTVCNVNFSGLLWDVDFGDGYTDCGGYSSYYEYARAVREISLPEAD